MSDIKKKKTDIVMKIVGGAFLLAVVAYFAVYVSSSLNEPYRTVTAVEYSVRESIGLEGVVVREEETLLTYYSSMYVAVEEGKRVSRGGVVGMVYSSDEELRQAERLREINEDISGLEALRDSGVSESQKVENSIKSEIQTMRRAVQTRQLANIGSLTSGVRTLMLSAAGDEGGIDNELQALYAEQTRLRSAESQPYDVIKASHSGLFSSFTDGFEDITPEGLDELTPEEVRSLMAEERGAPELAWGKLVYGNRWYYATIMPADRADDFDKGDKVTMIFGKYYSEYLEMTVDSVSFPDDDGNCTVIFSCDEAMVDVLDMRMQSAELILSEDTGVRVPKKAVRVDEEGRVYVFAQTGMQAEKRLVTIMHDLGEHYVIGSEELRPGDMVIVSGKGIYDGKVVR